MWMTPAFTKKRIKILSSEIYRKRLLYKRKIMQLFSEILFGVTEKVDIWKIEN